MRLSKLWKMIHATRLAAAVLRLRICQMSGGISSRQARGAVIARPIPAGMSLSVVGSMPAANVMLMGMDEFILLAPGRWDLSDRDFGWDGSLR